MSVNSIRKNYKTYLGWLFKLLITIFASVYIYNRLLDHRIGLNDFTIMVTQLGWFDIVLTTSLVTILMALNLITDAYKWQIMIASMHKIAFYEALCITLCGLTFGMITPNRIGDTGLRIMLLPEGKRISGAIVSASSGFSKLVVIHLLASFAVPIFLYLYKPELINWVYVIALSSLLYCITLLYVYFNINVACKWLERFRWFAKYRHFFEVLSTYDRKFQLKILIISFFRVFTLIVQYYLLLHLVLPFITFSQVTLMVILLITIQSAIPSIDILDLGIRGVAALFLFGFITNREDVIIAVTATIWFVNLVVPSLIGLLLIIILKQNKQTGALQFRF